MASESLADLQAAFEEWRSRKRHPREAAPADLLKRARQVARVHGMAAVCRATRIDRRHLQIESRNRARAAPSCSSTPRFSRLEIAPPTAAARPFAEVETVTGMKVRFFAPTEEMIRLLSSICSGGDA